MSRDSERYVVAIDLSTTAAKVALVSTGGEIVGYERERISLILIPGGGAEQSPDEWWEAIKKAATRLLSRRLIPSELIVAVSCTGQWSGTVAVDRDGMPLMNAVTSLDSRGAPHVRRVTAGHLRIEGYGVWKLWQWIRIAGGIPGRAGNDSVAHVLFIKNELPHVYDSTFKFLEPKDYLNLKLTGQVASSHEAMALHWVTDNRDIHDVRYDRRLLKWATLDGEKLPPLRSAVDILGPIRPEAADDLGLPRTVKVLTGTPDVFSAAIGSGAVGDYEPHLYLGTAAWLSCHVPYKRTDVFHNIASLPSAIPGRYLVCDEQKTAGACLSAVKDGFLLPDGELQALSAESRVYESLDRAVERTAPGSGKVIFSPWLYGERTPFADAAARGGVHNLSLETTRDAVVRAVFEGVAYNVRWMLGYVEKFVARRFPKIRAVGGGARSDIWCQIHADILDRPICQVADPILANLRGAAFLAAVGLGRMGFEDIPRRVPVARTYEPDASNRKIYDELFREFVHIYRANRRMYRRLNRSR